MEGKALGDGGEGAGTEGRGNLSRKGARSPEIAQKIPLSVKCLVSSIMSPPKVRLFPACIPWASSAKLCPEL